MDIKESCLAAPCYWWRLVFFADSDFEETLLWKLEDLGIKRVAVQYSPDNPQKRCFFVWVLETDWPITERDNLLRTLIQFDNSFGTSISNFEWDKVADEDWSKSWKQHWKPDPVGSYLLILPVWLKAPDKHSDRILLRLDPGSAFGTGSHPTTRLCLEAIEKNPPLNLIVADLGCGSGILSLAAIGFGAKEVIAVDIDYLAVRATNENAQLNPQLSGDFGVFLGSVDALRSELKGKSADLLLCNILAPVIEELAPSFDSLISQKGKAILSGVLVDQLPRLEDSLNSLGWVASSCSTKEQWAMLEIRRKAPKPSQ